MAAGSKLVAKVAFFRSGTTGAGARSASGPKSSLATAARMRVNTYMTHAQYRHPTKPALVTVPMHPGDLPIGTLKSIEKQAGVKLRR